jgi:hypothetical protein
MDSKKEPPLGLKPRYIHDEERMLDIKSAIVRMINADATISIEWVQEYNEIIKRGNNNGV